MKHYLSKIPTCLILLFIPFSTNQLSREEPGVLCRPKLNSLWCSLKMPLSMILISTVNGLNFSEIPVTTQDLIIDCKDKLIDFLSSDSFMNLKNLFALMILNCPSLRLREKLYLPQQNLPNLYLQNNAFTSDIFGKLKPSNSLTVLDLTLNKIKTLDFEFRVFPNLRVLDLNFNNIQNITSNSFKNCYNLRGIHFYFNLISTLVYKNEFGNTINIFDSQNLPNLKYLDLRNNEIFHIEFSMIPQTVEILKIYENPIHNVSCNEPYVTDHMLKHLEADWTLLEHSNICFPPSLEMVTLFNVTTWRIPTKILSAFIHFRKPQLGGNNFVFVVERDISVSSDILQFVLIFSFNDTCVHERFFNILEREKKRIFNNLFPPKQQIELIRVPNENSTVYCQFIQICSPVEGYDLNRKDFLGKRDLFYFTLSSRRNPVADCGNLMSIEVPSSLPKNIKELYLDGNNLSSVNLQQILEDYPHLETLYLNNSNIREIEVEDIILFLQYIKPTFTTLQILHLESNFLKIFPVKLIIYLGNLTSLYLQNNSLMEFNIEFVYSLNMENLHLEYNNISNFYIGYSENVAIKSLYLQYNKISKIEKRFCHYLIETLYLDNNEITEVELTCHDSKIISQIKKLFLRNNFLTVLKPFSFSTLINLQELHLDGNRIEYLEEKCLYDLPRLRKLFLQQNQLKYVGQKMVPLIIQNGKEFILLNIYKWNLEIREKSLNLSKINRKSDLLLDGISLNSFIEIDFGGNFIERIDLSVFNSLPFLVSIRLNNNRLREITCDQSFYLALLKEIHLEENRLTSLNGSEFKGLTKVTNLYLHQNELFFISKHSFKDMTSLEVLTLHGNKFQRLDILQFGFSSNFQILTIHQNPIVCECSYLDDLRDILKKVNFISNVSEVGCFSKENKNYLMEDYLIRFCDNKQMIIGFSVFSGILLLTVAISVLLYRYRQEIQVILYSRFGVRFFHDQSLDERKPFHAFIAYSSDDSEFVARQLLPGLEKYRLCLHDRNFVVGAFVQENIVNAVNHSACTVVVFSTSFVKSPWCRFEFRTAHDKSLNKGCRPIIVIVLEDVKPDDMEEEMKVYLTTSTYLRWEDQLFWEKLYFVLPSLNRNDNDRNNHPAIPLHQFNC